MTNNPKKVKIIWSERAREDLREIVLYIRQDSPQAARTVATQITEKTTRLELFPDSGRILPEFPNLSYREIIVGNYRVIYNHEEEEVKILTVRHGRQLLQEDDL